MNKLYILLGLLTISIFGTIYFMELSEVKFDQGYETGLKCKELFQKYDYYLDTNLGILPNQQPLIDNMPIYYYVGEDAKSCNLLYNIDLNNIHISYRI